MRCGLVGGESARGRCGGDKASLRRSTTAEGSGGKPAQPLPPEALVVWSRAYNTFVCLLSTSPPPPVTFEGGGMVVVQQVAGAVLDDKNRMRAAAAALASLPVDRLLAARESVLAATVRGTH